MDCDFFDCDYAHSGGENVEKGKGAGEKGQVRRIVFSLAPRLCFCAPKIYFSKIFSPNSFFHERLPTILQTKTRTNCMELGCSSGQCALLLYTRHPDHTMQLGQLGFQANELL